MILYKKVHGYKQRMFTTMEKKGSYIKNTPGYIQFLFMKTFKTFNSFFFGFIGFIYFRTLIPVILFPETLLEAPILF